ncbi:MAG: asparagine synthase, partial [Nitrosarchaeum sp.]|nr:asparagine synthase [Nitrosarchaeum sp.]
THPPLRHHENPSRTVLTHHLKTGKTTTSTYWSLNAHQEPSITTLDDAAPLLRSLLRSSVQYRLLSDVPLGAYLSGGLDSTAIVHMMRSIQGRDATIRTYSVAFDDGDDINEHPHAQLVADTYETKHHAFTIKPKVETELRNVARMMDEPLADPALLPVYLLSKRARKDVTVVLTGDGADELFAGYSHHKILAGTASKLAIIPSSLSAPAARLGLRTLPSPLLSRLHTLAAENREGGVRRIGEILANIKHAPITSYHALTDIFDTQERERIAPGLPEQEQPKLRSTAPRLTQLQHHDITTLLPDFLLMKTDRMTMAHGIEGRVPFLDYRMAELSMKLPPHLKLSGGTTKHVLREALKHHIPPQIIQRKKQIFHVPVERWIQKDLKTLAADLITCENLKTLGIDIAEAKHILEKQQRAPFYYGRQTWSLMTLGLWMEERL